MGLAGDTGTAAFEGHVNGNPVPVATSAAITVGHTWVIIVLALAILWLLGAGVFKSIRM